jgi:hypothetical protein
LRAAFTKKEEEMWEKIIVLRKERQANFFKQKIMEIDKIPKEIRQKIIKNNESFRRNIN